MAQWILRIYPCIKGRTLMSGFPIESGTAIPSLKNGWKSSTRSSQAKISIIRKIDNNFLTTIMYNVMEAAFNTPSSTLQRESSSAIY